MPKKILLSTPVFKPMVGGMETMANNLAKHFTDRGYEVILITPIKADEPDTAEYRIVRQPSPGEFYRLAKWADIIFSNGANLFSAPYTLLTGTPTIVRHTNYVASTVDGAGWYNGKRAPLTPARSILHHMKFGRVFQTIRGSIKLVLLRAFVKNFVTRNVAISDWMKDRHPLPNQTRIYNPFPIAKFEKAVNDTGTYTHDFFFLGRLISEKGVDVLIDAFIQVQELSQGKYSLCIIGDGPERLGLMARAKESSYAESIQFAGTKKGRALIDLLRQCRIAVLPSTWEEPFGGVSTELMAAEKNLIVSRDGALAEIVADGGLTFKNGDASDLTNAMLRLIEDDSLQSQHKSRLVERLQAFDEERLINAYVQLIESLT